MEKIYIKNEKLFKNKTQMVIYIILFCLLIYGFIYFGKKDYKVKVSDNERFASEFSLVSKDNVFKYVNGLISNISKDNRIVVEVVYAQVAYREKQILVQDRSKSQWMKAISDIQKTEKGIKFKYLDLQLEPKEIEFITIQNNPYKQ